MERKKLEVILENLIEKKIIVQYISEHFKCVKEMWFLSYSFGGHSINNRSIHTVALCSNKVPDIFGIAYNTDVKEVLFKDFQEKRYYEFEITYNDNSFIRVYIADIYNSI